MAVFLCRRWLTVQSGSRSPNRILNADNAFVQSRVRVHCRTAFWTARWIGLRAASSLGTWPLVLIALNASSTSGAWSASIAV